MRKGIAAKWWLRHASRAVPSNNASRLIGAMRCCWHASRAGNLVAVVVPDERDEALRDLSRTREDVLAARLRAHQQMKALLLRHGLTCPGRIVWSAAHERTLSTIHLPQPAQEIAFVE